MMINGKPFDRSVTVSTWTVAGFVEDLREKRKQALLAAHAEIEQQLDNLDEWTEAIHNQISRGLEMLEQEELLS